MKLPEVLDLDGLWRELPARAAGDDVVLDWLGNRWPPGSLPFLPSPGWEGPHLPYDSDGFRAGATEWAAFGCALRFSIARQGLATVVEMGASQGPWCVSWVRAHRRLLGGGPVHAVAFEAADARDAAELFWSAQGFGYVCEKREGLLELRGDNWSFAWRRQAVVHGGGVAYFPRIDIRLDNGAQTRRDDAAIDYRGRSLDHEAVQGIDPVAAVMEHDFVDFLHLDLQGGELEVLQADAFAEMAGRVGVVMLGTHSRTAESEAYSRLPAAGFVLLAEDPALFEAGHGAPLLTRDGEQLWVSREVAGYLRESDLLNAAFVSS